MPGIVNDYIEINYKLSAYGLNVTINKSLLVVRVLIIT
jgi:hypothetical protein